MSKEAVRLVKVDTDNLDDLIKLTVSDEQKQFVASNIYSMPRKQLVNLYHPISISLRLCSTVTSLTPFNPSHSLTRSET